MGNLDIGQFILFMVALVFSLSVHEFGHAWVSLKFGDDLAHSRGRVTLNPMAHVDPIGTLLFPAIGFFTGAPLLGWAKPVPVNPLRWRNKRVANFWVSSAGIIGNLLIATVAALALRVFVGNFNTVSSFEVSDGIWMFLNILFRLNIGLAIFNLLPVPPLDGGAILGSILPDSFEDALQSLSQYGFIILYIALFTGVIRGIFNFVMPLAYSIFFWGTPLAGG